MSNECRSLFGGNKKLSTCTAAASEELSIAMAQAHEEIQCAYLPENQKLFHLTNRWGCEWIKSYKICLYFMR